MRLYRWTYRWMLGGRAIGQEAVLKSHAKARDIAEMEIRRYNQRLIREGYKLVILSREVA